MSSLLRECPGYGVRSWKYKKGSIVVAVELQPDGVHHLSIQRNRLNVILHKVQSESKALKMADVLIEAVGGVGRGHRYSRSQSVGGAA